MWNISDLMQKVNRIIRAGAGKMPTEQEFILHEINRTLLSREWKDMVDGVNYFRGIQDILGKQRLAIGEGGQLEPVKNLPNSRVIDNVYRTMVKQKTNYLLGKPITISSGKPEYQALLTDILDKNFMRQLKEIGQDAITCGIGWLYVHYDEQGELKFHRFRPYEIIPEWTDNEHTELDSVIRFYDVEVYDGGLYDKRVTKVEVYTKDGVDYYEAYGAYGNGLVRCAPWHTDYMQVGGKSYNWDRLPFVAFKRDDDMTPLIRHCRSLQDGLNRILSNFEDNMEEDPRQSIIVLVNYDGTDLGEFRHNLAMYGAVKVRSDGSGTGGDVKTLEVTVNSENYKAISDIFRQAIIRNCMGYDAKDERMAGAPNEMNIRSMYNDIDLDASDMETEFQYSLDRLVDFIDLHLMNTGAGDFTREKYAITFNTDMPMDEASTISNIRNSVGIVSTETLLARHPWVDNVDDEMERLAKEKQSELDQQYNPFGSGQDGGGLDGEIG